MQEAYVVAGLRTAIGKAKKGAFRHVRPDDLAVVVIESLVKQVSGLTPTAVDDVIVGTAVPEAEQGLQMARWIALRSLAIEVPGVTINRYCGSGLEAIALATAKIKCGMADCIIAGGAESMSLVPTMGWKTAPNFTLADDHAEYFLSMGLTAEEVAQEHRITREESDAFALASHRRALAARSAGYFQQEIVPVTVEEITVEKNHRTIHRTVVCEDEGPRPDTSLEALSKLPPVFRQDGQVTAGNASQTSDGAAFVVVLSEAMVKKLNVKPWARLVTCVSAGVHPRLMGMGPVEAVPRALKRSGIRLQDVGVIELNEAFACQALAVMKALDLDPERVNPNGGAIALGHPLGCTGAVLTIKAVRQAQRQNQKYALVTACIGGGQGIAAVFEVFS
ncbi:MAG: thiolase family protein [Chitinophagales bacterium]|nr:thiolase family protein [Chitinophagales bacterium]MDW8426954.1 thiolase family protein [Chitinophagales bacterium]